MGERESESFDDGPVNVYSYYGAMRTIITT